MKLIIKILKISSILIITICVILFFAAFFLQDKVSDIILTSLNNNISTKLEVRDFRLSFLRKFPKASLELRDVLVHSSLNFDQPSFSEINTDTLIAARFVLVEFKITDVLKGNYNIERLGARTGKLNLFTDSSGQVNYEIKSKNKNPSGDEFTINLERINLIGIKTNYINRATNLIIKGLIKNGRLKSRISGDDIDFTADSEILIDSVQFYGSRIVKNITAELNLKLQSSEEGTLFKKGNLIIENYEFGLDGFISSENILDLRITGKNIDLSKIRNYLPDKLLNEVSEYDLSGILLVSGKIKGLLTRKSNPHIELSCSLNKGHIDYGKYDISFKDISFNGYFSNGSKNSPETSSASIRDITATLGSSVYSGSLNISGFVNPTAELLLKGRVSPKELKKFFNLTNISTTEGSVDLDLKLVSKLNKKESYTLSDIIDMNPEADLDFNSFSIGFNDDSILLTRANGNVSVSKTIRASNLELIFKGQEIKIDGEFRNLLEWMAGRPVQMIASADVAFNRLIPETFIKSSKSSYVSNNNTSAFSLPDDMLLDINFKIDSLTYNTFSSSKITGTLNYIPRVITFKTLHMKSLNGIISGNGFIVQNKSKSIIARTDLNVSNIDVNKAFRTFHNFGQDFLKAENIAGTLSGSLSVLIPMDSMMNPQIKSLTAEGKYILVNGALIDFDPVKELSSFIELSELENISFEKLENDFFIRNKFLYIPQMDVKSSAVDLSVNGKHSFDNDYEYHIKMLLSEFLSKKRKPDRSNVTEFGVVEDDGLGRTSLLLKIKNEGDVVKVGYDIKAVSSEVKNNIKSERQTLKTILNQEYGWFKSDSVVNKKPVVEKKSRFRISWEEADNVNTSTDPSEDK